MPTLPAPATAPPSADDAELIARVALRDEAAFEQLMRRHNGRLFRVARAILKDDAEAEDALQDAYLAAYRHAPEFRGTAQAGTWLTRIVINQSLMRARSQKRHSVLVPFDGSPDASGEGGEAMHDEKAESPATAAFRGELRHILESAIDSLPMNLRAVFVMREVEEMTVQETSECLGVPAATVRTRLFRARALLRDALARDLDAATVEVFGFAGARCDRIVAGVLARWRDSFSRNV